MIKVILVAGLLTGLIAHAQLPSSGCAGTACNLNVGTAEEDDLFFGTFQWCQNASTQASSWCCITTYNWYYPEGDTNVAPVLREIRTFKAQNPAYCYLYVGNGNCDGPGVYSCVFTAPMPPGPG